MRKTIYAILAAALIVAALGGCRTRKEQVRTVYQTRDSVVYQRETVTEYDSVIVPPDSSYISAFVECDSMNRVLVRAIETRQGRNIVSRVTPIPATQRQIQLVFASAIDTIAIKRRIERRLTEKFNLNATEKKRDFYSLVKSNLNWTYFFLGAAAMLVAVIIFTGGGSLVIRILKKLLK